MSKVYIIKELPEQYGRSVFLSSNDVIAKSTFEQLLKSVEKVNAFRLELNDFSKKYRLEHKEPVYNFEDESFVEEKDILAYKRKYETAVMKYAKSKLNQTELSIFKSGATGYILETQSTEKLVFTTRK